MTPKDEAPSATELRQLLDGGPQLLSLLGPEGRVRYVSRALAVLLGRSAGDLEGRSVEELLRLEPLNEARQDALPASGDAPDSIRRYQLRDADGGWRTLWANLAPFTDGRGRQGLVFRGHEIGAPEALGLGGVRFDVLTALPSRTAFLDRLERSIQRARSASGYTFALLLLDLDRFRRVNEGLGHLVGDRLVALFSRRLAASVRPGDLVARVGGDSFAVLVDHLHEAGEVRLLTERIHRALVEPLLVDGHEIYASVSIGASLSSPRQDQPLQVLREAEAAMYAAKERGGGRYELFDGTLPPSRLPLRLETGLRRALERGEFRAHYQPIVALASHEIDSFEVLARWQDPERGLLAPSEFIAAAEETGLVVPMAGQLLREACVQARRWQSIYPDRPAIGISMNFTSSHFEQSEVASTVMESLEAGKLDPRLLTVEITESVLMRNVEAVVGVLRDLRNHGIRVHLDDFGTGYSSLSYLQRLPCDAIKIDRSFVKEMENDRATELLVRSIVELAHGLGRRVVAEGVETRGQLAALEALGCEYVQGYLFSRPIDSEAVIGLLSAPLLLPGPE